MKCVRIEMLLYSHEDTSVLVHDQYIIYIYFFIRLMLSLFLTYHPALLINA